jgi:hypothetical protein
MNGLPDSSDALTHPDPYVTNRVSLTAYWDSEDDGKTAIRNPKSVVTKAEASKNQYPRADSALAVNVAFCGRSLAKLGLFKETRALPGRGTFKLEG